MLSPIAFFLCKVYRLRAPCSQYSTILGANHPFFEFSPCKQKKNTLPLTETRKRKGVELIILLLCQSQYIHTGKAGISRYSAQHLKHF